MLTDYLIEELTKLPYIKIYGIDPLKEYVPVVSINIEGFDSAQVGYLLNKNGIAVRTGFHCAPLIHGMIETCNTGTVRISPGYFNLEKDIESIVNEIIKIHHSA